MKSKTTPKLQNMSMLAKKFSQVDVVNLSQQTHSHIVTDEHNFLLNHKSFLPTRTASIDYH